MGIGWWGHGLSRCHAIVSGTIGADPSFPKVTVGENIFDDKKGIAIGLTTFDSFMYSWDDPD